MPLESVVPPPQPIPTLNYVVWPVWDETYSTNLGAFETSAHQLQGDYVGVPWSATGAPGMIEYEGLPGVRVGAAQNILWTWAPTMWYDQSLSTREYLRPLALRAIVYAFQAAVELNGAWASVDNGWYMQPLRQSVAATGLPSGNIAFMGIRPSADGSRMQFVRRRGNVAAIDEIVDITWPGGDITRRARVEFWIFGTTGGNATPGRFELYVNGSLQVSRTGELLPLQESPTPEYGRLTPRVAVGAGEPGRLWMGSFELIVSQTDRSGQLLTP